MADAPMLDDRFWATFRAGHPEVDVVLLPDPALTARPDGEPTWPASAEQVAAAADHLLDELDDHLTGRADWPTLVPRTRIWRRDPLGRRYLECRLVVDDLAPGRPVPLLRAVGNAFLATGWRARPLPGTPPRMAARRGPFRATATVTHHGLYVSLRSGLLPAEGTRPQ